MNKHSKNLQTMLALLPVEVCHVYRDTIHDAAIEIERLDTIIAQHICAKIGCSGTNPSTCKNSPQECHIVQKVMG